MSRTKSTGRFPAAVISCAVRWYRRFVLSLRDIEELLLERGVVVSYESVRNWSATGEIRVRMDGSAQTLYARPVVCSPAVHQRPERRAIVRSQAKDDRRSMIGDVGRHRRFFDELEW